MEETKKDRDLEEQFDRNWKQIVLGKFKFNIKEENEEYLKKCNKEGLIKFFKKYFINEMKKLDIEYVCMNHMEENENKINEEIKENSNIKKRVAFDKIYDFQACNSLYPCEYNKYYRELIK